MSDRVFSEVISKPGAILEVRVADIPESVKEEIRLTLEQMRHHNIMVIPEGIVITAPTPGDKLRAYAAARGWPQGDLDYLLGVLGEAVLVERHRASRVAQDWAARPEALTESGFVVAEFIGRDISAGG